MSSLTELESRVLILEMALDALPGGREVLFTQRSSQERQAQGGNVPMVILAPTPKTIPAMMTTHAYNFGSYREARECLEAIALCHGLGFVGTEFPAAWLQQLESVRHSRQHGMTWREALERAGLSLPSNLMDHALSIARETERLEAVFRVALQTTILLCPHNLQALYLPLLESLLED